MYTCILSFHGFSICFIECAGKTIICSIVVAVFVVVIAGLLHACCLIINCSAATSDGYVEARVMELKELQHGASTTRPPARTRSISFRANLG